MPKLPEPDGFIEGGTTPNGHVWSDSCYTEQTVRAIQEEAYKAGMSAAVPHMHINKLDGLIPNAIRGYLRRCSSGGMSKKQIDTVQANVDEADRLGYFKLAIAEAILSASPEVK